MGVSGVLVLLLFEILVQSGSDYDFEPGRDTSFKGERMVRLLPNRGKKKFSQPLSPV